MYHYQAELLGKDNKKAGAFEESEKKLAQLAEKVLSSVPAEDTKLLENAVNHPAWKRLTVFPTRHFIFIIPKSVRTRIKNDSIMRLDVAFTFEADFFGVSNTKYNERITVFLKELWGFRGGTGGGNQINIGFKWAVENHNPSVVDTMLYTHEMGHCMTIGLYWFLYRGFTEGIANMAMTMSEDCLGRHTKAAARIRTMIKRGEHYYINRNIPCWRVPNYDPSFTVMASLIVEKPLVAGAFDWARMRGALHDFLNFPIKPTSLFQYGQAWAKAMEPYFGEEVYAFYKRCRFPLDDNSKALLQDDLDFYAIEYAIARFEGTEQLLGLVATLEKENSLSYFRTVAMYKILDIAVSSGNDELAAEMVRKLGIIPQAMVLGPYNEIDGILGPLPPEEKFEPDKEYRTYRHTARWQKNNADANGFFKKRADYRGHWSGYATSFINVPQEMDAILWVRSRNGFALWLNNKLVEKEQMFARRAWTILSDFAYFKVHLKQGWNKLLGRFSFTSGEGLLRMRITGVGDKAIPNIKFTTENHEDEIPTPPVPKLRKKLFGDGFDAKLSARSWKIGSGKFRTKSGKLYSENGRARKFRWIVIADEKRDPDPAILWTKCKALEKSKNYRVEIQAVSPNGSFPAFYITLEGCSDDDICSGISIHIDSSRKALTWKLCYYDTVYYSGRIPKFRTANKYLVTIDKIDNFYSMTINDEKVFASLSLPAPTRGQVGLAFIKDALLIDSVVITGLK